MTPKTREINPQQEGRLVLAINALKKGQITSVCKASRLYDVPRATLQDRLRGCTERESIRVNGLRLRKTEEETLKKWIILLALRGAAPRPIAI
jgi:predicted HTH domain antitoxin